MGQDIECKVIDLATTSCCPDAPCSRSSARRTASGSSTSTGQVVEGTISNIVDFGRSSTSTGSRSTSPATPATTSTSPAAWPATTSGPWPGWTAGRQAGRPRRPPRPRRSLAGAGRRPARRRRPGGAGGRGRQPRRCPRRSTAPAVAIWPKPTPQARKGRAQRQSEHAGAGQKLLRQPLQEKIVSLSRSRGPARASNRAWSWASGSPSARNRRPR